MYEFLVGLAVKALYFDASVTQTCIISAYQKVL